MKIQLNEALKYFDKLILYLLHQKPPPKKYTPTKTKGIPLKNVYNIIQHCHVANLKLKSHNPTLPRGKLEMIQ